MLPTLQKNFIKIAPRFHKLQCRYY